MDKDKVAPLGRIAVFMPTTIQLTKLIVVGSDFSDATSSRGQGQGWKADFLRSVFGLSRPLFGIKLFLKHFLASRGGRWSLGVVADAIVIAAALSVQDVFVMASPQNARRPEDFPALLARNYTVRDKFSARGVKVPRQIPVDEI